MSEVRSHLCQKWDSIGFRSNTPLVSEVGSFWCQEREFLGVKSEISGIQMEPEAGSH